MRNRDNDNVNAVERMLSIRTIAEVLGFKEKTIRNRIARGSKNPFPIRFYRVGRSRRAKESELIRYMEGLES